MVRKQAFCTGRKCLSVVFTAGLVGLAAQIAFAQEHGGGSPGPLGRVGEVVGDAIDAVDTVVTHDNEDVMRAAVFQAHSQCFCEDPFPAAKTCGKCHPKHYREWSVSPHSYAQMSPVFNAFQNAENELLHGTIGDFCIRCHTPVGMALQEPRGGSNLDRHPTAREGITCVVCHRINKRNGRISGRMSLVAGGETQVSYGPTGNHVLADVLSNPDHYGAITTIPNDGLRTRKAHGDLYQFFEMGASSFCGSCHDVLFPLGFRLEDAFSEYKASPAAREDCVSCQDCHMGKVQGRVSGFYCEPVAKVGNVETPPRRRTSHFFAGPDHSVIHPGIFPHNFEAVKEEGEENPEGLATLSEWLQFDWRSPWGTEEFEANLPENAEFPEAWKDQKRRYDARRILNDQFRLLTVYKQKRLQVLREGFALSDIESHVEEDGLHFKVKISSLTNGHGVPTGFDGERPFYLQVLVWDRNNQVVFRSGDLDPNGDYRDDHSFFVHNGELPRDRQLFTLQSKFITRNIRGNEREQILPIPYSLNPLNFDRPALRPFTPLGRPLGARKHKQNLEPLGHRWAQYHVPACNLTGCGPYSVSVRFICGMIPINLVKTIEFTGFDYCMSSREVAEAIVRGHVVVREACDVIECHCD